MSGAIQICPGAVVRPNHIATGRTLAEPSFALVPRRKISQEAEGGEASPNLVELVGDGRFSDEGLRGLAPEALRESPGSISFQSPLDPLGSRNSSGAR